MAQQLALRSAWSLKTDARYECSTKSISTMGYLLKTWYALEQAITTISIAIALLTILPY